MQESRILAAGDEILCQRTDCSFLNILAFSQAPLLIFSFILISWKVNIPLSEEVRRQPTHEKLRRIDIPGSATLVGAVGGFLLAFSLKTTEELPWSHPLIVGLFVLSFIFGILFFAVESWWSPYPVMPLRLLSHRTSASVCIANFLGKLV
jgi:hypothetical protein